MQLRLIATNDCRRRRCGPSWFEMRYICKEEIDSFLLALWVGFHELLNSSQVIFWTKFSLICPSQPISAVFDNVATLRIFALHWSTLFSAIKFVVIWCRVPSYSLLLRWTADVTGNDVWSNASWRAADVRRCSLSNEQLTDVRHLQRRRVETKGGDVSYRELLLASATSLLHQILQSSLG